MPASVRILGTAGRQKPNACCHITWVALKAQKHKHIYVGGTTPAPCGVSQAGVLIPVGEELVSWEAETEKASKGAQCLAQLWDCC